MIPEISKTTIAAAEYFAGIILENLTRKNMISNTNIQKAVRRLSVMMKKIIRPITAIRADNFSISPKLTFSNGKNQKKLLF